MIIGKIERIEKLVGRTIPKPRSKHQKVKGWGRRQGERALVYWIPNHKDPENRSQKGVNESEWRKAHKRLMSGEPLTRAWFQEKMRACDKEGGCNFTTIGGIFQLLRIAKYDEKNSQYIKV
ncbi:MAG: hypothetical protein PHR28_06345 [candidate division Zixibacteria bacterium]|nr:hypothetical protein [candidate division Zixibacteria bacterium]